MYLRHQHFMPIFIPSDDNTLNLIPFFVVYRTETIVKIIQRYIMLFSIFLNQFDMLFISLSMATEANATLNMFVFREPPRTATTMTRSKMNFYQIISVQAINWNLIARM